MPTLPDRARTVVVFVIVTMELIERLTLVAETIKATLAVTTRHWVDLRSTATSGLVRLLAPSP